MKHRIRRSAEAVRGFQKSRPKEVRWSLYGMGVGVLVGGSIGGVGMAALGGAFGVPAFLILAIVGMMIGNRIGIEKDNAALAKADARV